MEIVERTPTALAFHAETEAVRDALLDLFTRHNGGASLPEPVRSLLGHADALLATAGASWRACEANTAVGAVAKSHRHLRVVR